MAQELINVAIVVDDYDKAIRFYIEKLNFELVEDTRISESKRWVRVRPKGPVKMCLLLAKAADTHQSQFVGNQSGGRVFLFIHTDDFTRDYQQLISNDVKIIREPIDQPYGTVAVFEDLYGNLFDLIGPK